jgi:hypothetical protein
MLRIYIMEQVDKILQIQGAVFIVYVGAILLLHMYFILFPVTFLS